MKDCKPLATLTPLYKKLAIRDGKEKVDDSIYWSLVGLLIYLTNTRPDMVYAISIVSKHMSKPSKVHFFTTKRILRYVKGTKTFCILYKSRHDSNLIGYINSDCVGNVDCKSKSGYTFLIRLKVISWVSKKLKIVALLSAKIEYIARTSATTKAIWL